MNPSQNKERKHQPPGGGPEKPESEFTREELLWLRRTQREADHRYYSNHFQILYGYRPMMEGTDPENWADEKNDSGRPLGLCDTWHKSVPLYFLSDDYTRWNLVATLMEKYLYRRWFRPYRSDIDTGEFTCKFIMPKGLGSNTSLSASPLCSADIATLLSLHQGIVAEAQRLADTVTPGGTGAPLLRPLFRALIIVTCSTEYDDEDSTTIGRFPVYLVRTGVEDGLSAPVSFDTIADKVEPCDRDQLTSVDVVKTTLETAVGFVMALEAREVAAFGLPPAPPARPSPSGISSPYYESTAINDKIRHELTTLPSSQWVSDEKAKEWGWCGIGRRKYKEYGDLWERRVLGSFRAHRHAEKCVREAFERGEQDQLPEYIFLNGYGTSSHRFKRRVEAKLQSGMVASF